MSIVRVEEEIQPLKYLVITQERDPESLVTTNIVLTDNRLNKINLINIERGPQGSVGPMGPQGPSGLNGVAFDILPVSSGGTNNSSFISGNIVYYDGDKLSSSSYTFEDIINLSSPNAVTGIISGSGIYKLSNGNNAEIGINVGDGLVVDNNNQIAIDNTVVRKVELNLGSIDGLVPISKGGTNNQTFISNRLLYYDGSQISSFPLSTGRIVVSGMTIDIVAGSGLTGGGKVTLPSGSIVLNIGGSSDIIVENNAISLSTTGNAGTYSKVTTDTKGRVISGSNLTQSDILSILGYTPWNPGNDGEGSGLDADLLDGYDSSYFLNLANSTGIISGDSLPIQTNPGTFSKVQVNDKGIVINGLNNNYFDIVNALGFVPVNTSGDTINGSLIVNGDTTLNSDNVSLKDNLPMFGTNSATILPSEPRGFSFLYGGYTEKTGILAYYPAEQQLRLVTNITSLSGTVDGGDGSGNQFMDDIDGGNQNAVYLVNNLTGIANIVLFRNTADSLYVSRINSQAISGLKTFVDGLIVNKQLNIVSDFGQSTPPIVVNNSNMVENLNVDLLHGHNDSYYRNAINMTGLFSYENVQFDNLDGTAGYIARFDTRTNNPSRTVSNSIIKEKTDSSAIVIENQANLFVGSTNSGSFLANRSVLAGSNNKIYQDNSLAVGTNNIISGDNSVALNSSSITLKNNSIAAGNNGYTWSENQFSFGAFADSSGSTTLGQGQYSSVSLGLNGVTTNGNWSNMAPSVVIPKNKTIAYNLEVVLNKVAGTGAAVIAHQSGIIKNSTYRDPNNLTTIRNISTILKDPIKNEVYNDSQYRNHYFNYQLNDSNTAQNLSVTRPPLQSNSLEPQNVAPIYKYVPSYTTLSGTFVKTNDGQTLLSFDKPITSGWFYKSSGSHSMNIKSYNHNMTSGCYVNINFMSGSIYKPHSQYYLVSTILDKDNFIIDEIEWEGWLTNNTLYIDNNSYYSIDSTNRSIITGIITTNSNVIYNTTSNPVGIFSSGMNVAIEPIPGIYPTTSGLTWYGKVVGVTNNSITIDTPYTGLYNNTTVNCSGHCRVVSYTEYHLNNTKTLALNIPGSGYGPVTRTSGISVVTGTPFCNSGLSITITGINAPYSGQKVSFSPGITNSGIVNLIHRRNFNGVYTQNSTTYKKYDCIYVQYPSISGVSTVRLYNQELKDIYLPSAPFSYSLVCGYGGIDNDKFYISGNKLYANTDISFEPNIIYDTFTSSITGVLTSNSNIIISDIEHVFSGFPTPDSSGLIYPLYSGVVLQSNIEGIIYSGNIIDSTGNIFVTDTVYSGTTTTGLLAYSGYLPIEKQDKEYYIRVATHDRSNNTYQENITISSGIYDEFGNHSLPSTSFNINNIFIQYNVPELVSSGEYMASFLTQGGYSPYVIFNTASNSITGVLTSGSNIISNCIDNVYSGYPTTNISGFVSALYSGMVLHSNIPGVVYSGTIVALSGSSILTDTIYSGVTSTGLLTRSGTFPSSQQYYPNELFVFNSSVLDSLCSNYTNKIYTKGFSFDRSVNSTGYYTTGIASIYTSYGTSKVTIGSLGSNMNLYPDIDNNIHIRYTAGAITGFVKEKTYHAISGIAPASFDVDQLYLYPNSGINHTGLCLIDLDNNHGYRILDDKLINQIPIHFESTSNTNSNRLPKNNLFDIVSISGNTITVDDSKNYLLKEINKPDYFEQPIHASYSTNGFAFSGIFLSGLNNIFDCFYTISRTDDPISLLNSSTIIGSTHYSWNDQNILFAQGMISFSGRSEEGAQHITLTNFNPSYALVSGMSIYSSGQNVSLDGIGSTKIIRYAPESGMILISQPIYGTESSLTSGTVFNLYIKPYIELDKPICLYNQYVATGFVFFNGNSINIANLSTPRTYLNANDQIKILQLNNNNYTNTSYDISKYAKIISTSVNNTRISGVSTNLYSFGLSRNTLLPITGTLSFMGSVSGYFTLPYNNIYYNSYGGTSSNWPRDTNGSTVHHPITGYYTIGTSSSSCSSGVLCINIEGFTNTNFNYINDVINRNNIGKNNNIVDTDNTTGYIRPWGVGNKTFYFDFSDNCPEINGLYYINDKLNAKTITINIPYNTDYLNRSGLVYIIDSSQNIKSNTNPNLDNVFVSNNADISIPQNSNLYSYAINTFNNSTKRWKHLVHFNNAAINYSGYDVSIKTDILSKILAISPDTINISSIQYSIDDGATYNNILVNDTLVIPSIQNTMYLRIATSDGSNKWSNTIKPSAPKINIYGLSSYSIDTENITYDYNSKIWYIDVIVTDIYVKYNNHKITVTASDESGRDSFDIYLNTNAIPEIQESNVAYTYQNGNNWILSYNIKNLTNDHLIIMSGYPGANYSISDEQLLNSSGIKIVSGPPGSVAGTYHPTLIVRDLLTDELLATRESTIIVLPLNQQIPGYTIAPQGLDDDILLNYTDNAETKSFDFYLPAIDDVQSELSVTFEPDTAYSITPIIEYSNYSQRYRVTAVVSGAIGYYPYKNVNISINQPTLNENDELIWNNYSYNKSINLTLYKELQISKDVAYEPIISDIQQPWAIHFTVVNGVTSHRPDVPPKVKLSNLPTIGTYEDQPLEYIMTSVYDSGYKRWNISAIGKPDIFQNYTQSTGYHSIKIYAEDNFNLSENSITLLFNQTKYLSNVKPYIYSTANNSYYTNLDVKNTDFNNSIIPTVDIPGDLRENTINLTLKYAKYDREMNFWELAYSGSPIYDKWDVDIDISNTNRYLGPQEYSVLNVKCKGIATDKLYGVGKLDFIELDTNFIPGIPLTITEIQTPYYQATEGGTWKVEFSTIGGLENPNYPPSIIFSGLPTPCSGYNARSPLQQQNPCFISRSWNSNSKKWSFVFEGLPLCNIEGLKNFNITAIDTDNVFYYGTDSKNASILYKSLIDSGFDHPSPTIVPLGPTPATVSLYPLCNNTSVDLYYKFGPVAREKCPFPTGITGWAISGSLPSGLSYSISFPGGNPKPPWNNIGSGTLRITGIPTTFANGGLYNEKLYLTVRDARNKFFTKEFKFTDASTANPPSPISLPVYFDSINNTYTLRSATANSPSGTAKVDKYRAGNITVYWPPAEKTSLDCLSILPHNQCSTSAFYYDGGNYNAGNINVLLSGTRIPINNQDKIYVEFDNDPNNEFNGKYSVIASGPNRFIQIPGQYFATGVGRLVLEKVSSSFNTNNLQKFDGTINPTTTRSILGCGYVKYEDGEYGLYGRMHPTFIADIKTSGSFKNTDVFLTGLNITKISQYQNETGVYAVKTFNCWETGYLRISGICLPRPTLELTNPPPAYDLAPFSYNNQAYSVLTRCVYGNSTYERDLSDNYRTININYALRNISNGNLISNGTVSSLQAGIGNGQPIQFNNTLSSGAVFSVKLSNNPDAFPTYNYNSIPYTSNEYFWIHKAGNREVTPTQASFPSVIVTGLQDFLYVSSGSAISGFTFRAIGGYIPYVGVTQQIPFYKLSDNTVWNLIDYSPAITGIVQKLVNKTPITGTYVHSGQNYNTLSVSIPQGYYSSQDIAYLSFPDNIINNTGIALTNNTSTISIPLSRPGQSLVSGYVIAYSLARVETISHPYITLRHNNIPFATGDHIDINDILNISSTEFNMYPSNDKLSIVSGNAEYITLSYSGVSGNQYNNINISGYYNLYKNYYDQINITNLTYIKDGEWRFSLSGTNNELYKDYNYKIISSENTGLPAFSGTSLTPKKHLINYPLYIQKPIKIILSQNVIDNGIINNNGVWSLTFNIDGGRRPMQNYTPEIYINDSICNFSRNLSVSEMKDQYDSTLDQLVITITSVNNPANYDWKNIQSFELKVSDDTGYDTKTINMNQ